jgi:putative membrane protein
MAALFAFLHHLAAFALVSALVVEFVLIKGELSLATARRIRLYDAVYGASAGIVLVIGLLRVGHFEKGAAYYLHSLPFIAKLSLFVLIGLLSIYPTREFIGWGKHLKQGQLPPLDARKLGRIRTVIHLEMAGLALMILCAAMMARGIGFFG